MKTIWDCRIKANFEDFKEIKKKLEFCEKLNMKNLILEPINNLKKIPFGLKNKIEKETNIKVFFRINLKPISTHNFKETIRNYNDYPDLLSIETPKKEIQILAAKDSRIDIISYSDQNILKTLTPGVISLVKQNKSFIEFSLAPIMINNKAYQSKNFRNLYRFLQLAMKLKVQYIISGNFDELYDFRNPRALISICYSLLGIPLIEAKKIFKVSPLTLLSRVQNRQNKKIIESGVKLIKDNEK
ncbi:MAG: RNase P subunit p30 family protein [Promethearchaeota archaeon]